MSAALVCCATVGHAARLARHYVKPQVPVRVLKDLEYGKVGGEALRLDMYMPGEKLEPRPCIVCIHGGGWTSGDKSSYATRAKEFAEHGYVAVSVDYRLAPKFRYPAAIEDVQLAVQWLRAHAAEYGIRADRIGSTGESAGGHLASMLGVTEALDRKTNTMSESSRVQCVVDWFGRMDLLMDQPPVGFADYRPVFMGKPKKLDRVRWMDASPINHVDAKTPPFLIIQGTRDHQVIPAHSTRMLEALDKAGVEAQLMMVAGNGHGFGGPAASLAWDATLSFFDIHLKRP